MEFFVLSGRSVRADDPADVWKDEESNPLTFVNSSRIMYFIESGRIAEFRFLRNGLFRYIGGQSFDWDKQISPEIRVTSDVKTVVVSAPQMNDVQQFSVKQDGRFVPGHLIHVHHLVDNTEFIDNNRYLLCYGCKAWNDRGGMRMSVFPRLSDGEYSPKSEDIVDAGQTLYNVMASPKRSFMYFLQEDSNIQRLATWQITPAGKLKYVRDETFAASYGDLEDYYCRRDDEDGEILTSTVRKGAGVNSVVQAYRSLPDGRLQPTVKICDIPGTTVVGIAIVHR